MEGEKKVKVYKKKKNWKNATGAPSKYKDTYPEEIVSRFKSSQEKIYYEFSYYKPSEEQEQLYYNNLEDKKDRTLMGWLKNKNPKIIRQMFPTLQRRAANHWVLAVTLTQCRALEFPKFFEAIETCKEIQEAILLEGWLSNVFNPAITQLILKNNHGYRDKTEVVSTNVELEVTDDQKNKLLSRFQLDE